MTDNSEGRPVVQKWSDIWRLFSREEQEDACRSFFDALRSDESLIWTRVKLVDRLAKATKFRKAEVERLMTADSPKLAGMLVPRVNNVFDEIVWPRVFANYYAERRAPMMCAFLDALGIAHNSKGGAEGDMEPPSESDVSRAVAILDRTYSAEEVGRYMAVLVRHNDVWIGAVQERDRRLKLGAHRALSESDAEAIARASDRFSVLDRVITREIVRSAAEIDGALQPPDLEQLVETVRRMNEQWHRAYFHVGLMDALLPTRSVSFDRPEYNDVRREWYLAGVMVGLARSHAREQLGAMLGEQAEDFDRAAKAPGGAGAAIARTCFRFLVEAGRLGEALRLLQYQIRVVGLSLGQEAIEAATDFIRQGEIGSARQIVDVVRQHVSEFEVDEDDDDEEGAEELERFKLNIERRFGQCLQAQGQFDGAERAFRKLQEAGEDKTSPDLLADLGLVKGAFPSLAEVRLYESAEQRANVREALAKGEPHFTKAIALFGVQSPKACYSMAVLDYLRWSQATEAARKENLREKAASQAADALAAIQGSDFESTYRDIGALGQCHFMFAVLKAGSFDAVQGREAMAAWRAITDAAGQLPTRDLKVLLEGAETFDSAAALEIAESIWRYRKDKAVDVIGEGPWIGRSPYLSREILGMARSEDTPRHERVGLWCSVIPGLNRSNEIDLAREGLDQLESLAEEPALARRVLDFVSDTKNVDPAWTPSEIAWSRVQLMRGLQLDADCALVLRDLFFAVRDSNPWEAEEILSAFEEWRLDEGIRSELASLLPQRIDAASPSIEQRLRAGERVRLLFVGGNEIQQQYDEEIKRDFSKEWPGVRMDFEHSGWSSNWGRDLDRLVRAANESDAVVLMRYMRTLLGRRLRAALQDTPWIPCTSSGKRGVSASLRKAAVVGLGERIRREAG